jgi:protein-arginine kinase activator protein McsA
MTLHTICKRCKQPLTLTLPDSTTELEAQSVSDNALCEPCATDARAALARYAANLARLNQKDCEPSSHAQIAIGALDSVAGDKRQRRAIGRRYRGQSYRWKKS